MIAPDDPRHGTFTGYTHAACRCTDCRRASTQARAQYRKRAYFNGPSRVSNLGTVRRLQALAALGWTLVALAERTGRNTSYIHELTHGERPTVLRETHHMISALYDELCMTVPPESWRTNRARNRARKYGWFPPLAWDNIDDPDEYPGLGVLYGEDAA